MPTSRVLATSPSGTGSAASDLVSLISYNKGGPAKLTSALGDGDSPIRTKCQVLTAANGRVVADGVLA